MTIQAAATTLTSDSSLQPERSTGLLKMFNYSRCVGRRPVPGTLLSGGTREIFPPVDSLCIQALSIDRFFACSHFSRVRGHTHFSFLALNKSGTKVFMVTDTFYG